MQTSMKCSARCWSLTSPVLVLSQVVHLMCVVASELSNMPNRNDMEIVFTNRRATQDLYID